MQDERYTEIERQNKILLEKMAGILNKKQLPGVKSVSPCINL